MASELHFSPAQWCLLNLLLGRAATALEEDVFSEIMALAAHHRVRPLLIHAVLGSADVSQVGRDAICKLRREAQWHELTAHQQAAEAKRISALLKERDVSHAFFKGIAGAAQLYGSIGRRPAADLDLLAPAAHLPDIAGWLRDLGYRQISRSMSSVTLAIPERNLALDLHATALEARYYHQLPTALLLEHAVALRLVPTELVVPAVSLEHLLLINCLHGLKHMWCKLIWIFDLIQALSSASARIDWPGLLGAAQHYQLERPLLLGFEVAHQLSALPLPEPLQRLAERERDLEQIARWMLSVLFIPRAGRLAAAKNTLVQMRVLRSPAARAMLLFSRARSFLTRALLRVAGVERLPNEGKKPPDSPVGGYKAAFQKK